MKNALLESLKLPEYEPFIVIYAEYLVMIIQNQSQIDKM